MSEIIKEIAESLRDYTIHMTWYRDEIGEAPWDLQLGIVSDWERLEPTATKWHLSSSGQVYYRTYDYGRALEVARNEGWGISPESFRCYEHMLGRTPTNEEILEAAVRDDYRRMLGWCMDEWYYVGYKLKITDPAGNAVPTAEESLWYIESTDMDYYEGEVMEHGRLFVIAEANERHRAACSGVVTV